jgi:hypothetical protein
MSKRLYSQFSTLVLLSLSLGIIFLATSVGFPLGDNIQHTPDSRGQIGLGP